ncbi:Hypothetical protein CINCED_3A006231 [Cinara cedri]|uniref:Uncharacterized protein n=1 Tax=Cinara cedri TaxID=506608 RepID=A0A5E4M7A1_9HEMI|nr:Hypothetical protein CINCED_3A006231 [Cinara cedri]
MDRYHLKKLFMEDNIGSIEVTTAGGSETQLSAVESAQAGFLRSSSCNCRVLEVSSLASTSLNATADEESVSIVYNDNDSTVRDPLIADLGRLNGRKRRLPPSLTDYSCLKKLRDGSSIGPVSINYYSTASPSYSLDSPSYSPTSLPYNLKSPYYSLDSPSYSPPSPSLSLKSPPSSLPSPFSSPSSLSYSPTSTPYSIRTPSNSLDFPSYSPPSSSH